MATHGLLNGGMPGIPPKFGGMPSPDTGFDRALPDQGMPTTVMPGIPPKVGGSGYQQFDEGVDEIGQAFRNYLTQNPHADRDAPNIDTFDAFRAGVEFGRTPSVEEFGKPYVPPNVDEFEGFAEEGTPGFADPKGEYRQNPPSSFTLDPNDPRNAYLNQGVPSEIQPQPPNIDITDILGTPRG